MLIFEDSGNWNMQLKQAYAVRKNLREPNGLNL